MITSAQGCDVHVSPPGAVAPPQSKAPKRYERLAEFLREGQFDPRCEGQDLQARRRLVFAC